MAISFALMLLAAASSQSCASTAPGEVAFVPTEQSAVAVARVAWRAKFSETSVKEREPYHAVLAKGKWHVFGTLPSGWRGGTPEAVICASNGKVLQAFHSR
jgi:hypothetical protein